MALETERGVLIVAEGLKDSFLAAVGLTGSVIATFSATLLERKLCKHPFYDRTSVILLGEHVTLEAGTGCVHTAPGHGHDDFLTGMAYGLEIYAPVDDEGRFTPDVARYAGLNVFKANRIILDDMKQDGSLLQEGTISHSYPHCWRCQNPVIFRATAQWFISMDAHGLRARAQEAIKSVRWVPAWGEERMSAMMAGRPDCTCCKK